MKTLTGLKDRLGNDICVGDVVEFYHHLFIGFSAEPIPDGGQYYVCEVVERKNGFFVTGNRTFFGDLHVMSDFCRIVGNMDAEVPKEIEPWVRAD